MNNLSYNLSNTIQKNIDDIESLRSNILLKPLNPSLETRLRWEANINKTYWGLLLAKNSLTKKQLSKLLSNPIPKKLKDNEKETVGYMQALNLIRENWSATIRPLTAKSILDLYNLSCKDVFGSTLTYYKSKVNEVEKILAFLESGNDHPVIKSGLLQIGILKLSPFENATGRVARLLSHLILSKYGYDLRGLLVLEDYYNRKDLVSLKIVTQTIDKYKNATIWLEYFTYGIKCSMEKVLDILNSLESDTVKIDWIPTNRQKKILEYLENPNFKITNKIVQKKFSVSQITASRELSKMANLGMILPHGKGRAVFYTK